MTRSVGMGVGSKRGEQKKTREGGRRCLIRLIQSYITTNTLTSPDPRRNINTMYTVRPQRARQRKRRIVRQVHGLIYRLADGDTKHYCVKEGCRFSILDLDVLFSKQKKEIKKKGNGRKEEKPAEKKRKEKRHSKKITTYPAQTSPHARYAYRAYTPAPHAAAHTSPPSSHPPPAPAHPPPPHLSPAPQCAPPTHQRPAPPYLHLGLRLGQWWDQL